MSQDAAPSRPVAKHIVQWEEWRHVSGVPPHITKQPTQHPKSGGWGGVWVCVCVRVSVVIQIAASVAVCL
jgi:hypothetical protein